MRLVHSFFDLAFLVLITHCTTASARTRPNARDRRRFPLPWPFPGWMCRAGPAGSGLHLLITLKKSWTWTLGKGPWGFCRRPTGWPRGVLKAEEETEDGAMDYSGAYDLARFVRMSHNVAYA